MMNSLFVLLNQHYRGDQIRVGVWHVRREDSNVYRLLPGKPAHLECHDVYGWIILKGIRNRLEDVDWMKLNQDSNT